MSGPKDYAFRFALARLQRIRARIEAERTARASMVRTMLARQRDASIARIDAKRSTRAAAIQSEMEKRKQAASAVRNQIASHEAEAVSEERRASDVPIVGSRPTVENKAIESAGVENAPSADGEVAMHHELAEVRGWAEAMQTDQTVKDFCFTAVGEWRKRADAVLAKSEIGSSATEIHGACETILYDAQRIFDEAGDLKGKFDTRNELLADIIASFKEIGFHVSDPFFEHPDDPTGPAILKATCGSETVTASIDLGTTVRSVWDGVESEQCKDAFFAYVDRMKHRGVEVEPERADLRERPKLLQKGANELPRTQSSSAGG
jgi:hypothetical protein